MRHTVAALLALTGFLAAALLGVSRGGIPLSWVLGRALVALAAFGLLGYGLGVIGERLARELLDKGGEKATEKQPEKPPTPGPAAAAPAAASAAAGRPAERPPG